MYWVIRWADGDEDKAAVIEAETRAAAECAALKRNIPAVFVGEADEYDLRDARRARMLFKYTRGPKHSCLGRPVGQFQLACFMLAGTMTVLLHVNRVLQQASFVPSVQQWLA